MERGSDKHGPRLDEHQKQETEGLVRGGGTTHAEEWKEPEPSAPAPGEGLEAPSRTPGHEPGVPEGLSADDMERRSDLARWVGGTRFPMDRAELLARAEDGGAPDAVIEAVRSLPDRRFANIAEVATALGMGKEEHRW